MTIQSASKSASKKGLRQDEFGAAFVYFMTLSFYINVHSALNSTQQKGQGKVTKKTKDSYNVNAVWESRVCVKEQSHIVDSFSRLESTGRLQVKYKIMELFV